MIRILESKTTDTVGKYWYYLICDEGDTKPTGEFPADSGKIIADGSRLFETGTEIRYELQSGEWVAIGQVDVPVPVFEDKTVTPTTSEQTVTADEGYDALGTVTVEAVTAAIDSNITAGNIKKDVTILGVTGDYDPQPNLEALSVTPTTSAQSIIPESPVDGYSQVSVSAVTATIDQNIVAGNIKKDVQILGVTGSYEGSGGEYNATLKMDNSSEFIYSDAVLTSINIPSSITSIGDNAFSDCTSLETVTISNGVETIGGSAFYGCASLTDVTIPSSVTLIGEHAFYGCTSLKNLTIPEGVETIYDGTFAQCSSLTSITIPSSVKLIGNENDYGTGAFSDCTSLETVTISNGVETIGGNTFAQCTSLTSITIPSSAKIIGKGAFSNCSSLEAVNISSGVETIEEYSFTGCTSLTSITIPSSVNTIDVDTFIDCDNLITITINKAESSITGAPWGATNATVIWDGE